MDFVPYDPALAAKGLFETSLKAGTVTKVSNRFFGIRDLAFLKVGIRDFSGKDRRYSGLELVTGRGI